MTLVDGARLIFALLATLALIGGAAWIARRFGMVQLTRQPSERRLKVVESLMLDPRRRLVIVRMGDQDHLLLLGPGGDRKVGSCAAPREDAA